MEINEAVRIGEELKQDIEGSEIDITANLDPTIEALTTLITSAKALESAKMPEKKEVNPLQISKVFGVEERGFNQAIDLCQPVVAKKDVEIERLKKKNESVTQAYRKVSVAYVNEEEKVKKLMKAINDELEDWTYNSHGARAIKGVLHRYSKQR